MENLLEQLRFFCTGRVGIACLGLFALANLIWFVAPYLGLQSITYRVLIIIFLIAGYLLFLLIRRHLINSQGKQLYKKIQAQDENIAGRQLEIELLKEKMNEAIASLKASELGVRYRGNAALYALPWFMVIGASAAGKSTLLRNSGLHFSFASQEDLTVKGFGGTRNCDWWFADEAILLDTAGRYTTEEEDAPEWSAFLALLKKYRPRLPINGIIVAISLVDILTADAEGMQWHVKVIRERIEELYSQLGYVFPVYLVFTKCDLLQGFSHFFADLSEAERNQVWGIYNQNISLSYEQRISYFAAALQQNYQHLIEVCLQKLALERNLKIKNAIYDFPEQFRASHARLIEFIRLLFKPNPYQETPLFYGIYFTSGTQEGTPIQRLVGNMHAAFGYVDQHPALLKPAIIKSYFIKEVFGQVIFPNKNLAAKTRQRLQWQHALKSATVIAATAIIVTAFMAYGASFTSNVLLLWQGETVAKNLLTAYRSNTVLPALLAAGNYYHLLDHYQQQIPLHLRLGLYRGNSQRTALQTMLLAALQPNFASTIANAVEQQLNNDAIQWRNATSSQQQNLRGPYYSLLRAYLMLGFPIHLQIEQAAPILSSVWAQQQGSNIVIANDELQAYENLVVLYLQSLQASSNLINNAVAAPLTIKTEIIDQARQQLYLPTNAANLYAELRSTAVLKFPALTLNDLSPKTTQWFLSNQTLPGIFTPDAWRNYIQPSLEVLVKNASNGDWVMDAPLTELDQSDWQSNSINVVKENQLTTELRQLYFSDYVTSWEQFISAIQITPFSSLDDASTALLSFAKADGPMVQLLEMINANFALKNNYGEMVSEMDQPYASMRKILAPNLAGKPSEPIKTYLTQLTAVQKELQTLAASSDPQHDAQSYAAKILANDDEAQLNQARATITLALTSIENDAAKVAVKTVMLQPLRTAWQSILLSATEGLQQQWQTQVYANYQQNLAGNFPFAHSANNDAAINDVVNFFQPNSGVLWNFVTGHLFPYLIEDETGWHEQQWLGVSAGFSPQFLQALSQAKLISTNLFANGSQPSFSFQFYPQPTPGIGQIILSVNDQEYHYQNGPQQWQSISWSAATNNASSELTATAVNGLSPDTLTAEGPWNLFHLLAKAQLTALPNNVIQATWSLVAAGRHYPVTLLLQNDNHANLFQLLLVNSFTLPNSLFSS